jgi:hypothetical protein
MHSIALRLPESVALRCYESTNVADAGFIVKAPRKVKGMPETTGWVSFDVVSPKPMTARALVDTLRALVG